MKLFKRIYYSVIGVLIVLLFTLTVVDVNGGQSSRFDTDGAVAILKSMPQGEHSVQDYTNLERVRNAIVGNLSDAQSGAGLAAAAANDELSSGTPVYYVQSGSVDYDEYIGYTGGDSEEALNIKWPVKLNNVIVAFPASSNPAGSKTVVLTAHYDALPNEAGIQNNLTSVAAMLTVIRDMAKAGDSYKNNIVFVFTDSGEFYNLGAVLAAKFSGLSGVMQNAGFTASFDSYGSSGTSVLTETTAENGNLIKNYAKVSNKIYNSSLLSFIYSNLPSTSDMHAFSVPGLSFGNTGNNGATGATETVDKVAKSSRAFISQHGDMMNRIVAHFGAADLDGLSGGGNAVFFSYLNLMVYYPVAVAFVLGGLILALLLAIITSNKIKKAFSFKKMGLGAAVQGLAVVCTAVAVAAAYYIFAFFGWLFGKLDLHTIYRIQFSSPTLVVVMLAFAALFTSIFHNIFKKVFKVRAGDVVNGSIVIYMVLAAALAFALPEASFLMAWIALLEGIVLLCMTLLKDKFKEKFNYSIERLFLPLLPMILLMPLTLSAVILCGSTFGAWTYPILAAFAALTCGFITPYFSYLKPALNRVFERLPQKRVRVAPEPAADEAPAPTKKQSRSKNVKNTRNARARANAARVKPKEEEQQATYALVNRSYTETKGFAILGVILALITIIYTAAGGSLAQNVTMSMSYEDYYTNNALVYVSDSASATGNYWMVDDLDAYQHMARNLDGYEYNKDKKAYVKSDAHAYELFNSTTYEPSFEKGTVKDEDGYRKTTYTMRPAFNSQTYKTMFVMEFDNSAGQIAKIDIEQTGDYQRGIDDIERETVRIIGDYRTLRIYVYTNSDNYSVPVKYTQYVSGSNFGENILKSFEDASDSSDVRAEWKDLAAKVSDVRGAMVFHRNYNFGQSSSEG